MTSYLGGIWKCRYFWVSLVRNDLRTRYRRSLLGIGWSLLQPIAMTTVLCFVFKNIFGYETAEFAPFLMSGISFWSFFTMCTVVGSHAFFTGEPYIRQYPAPMAIYPLRSVLGAGFHFLMALLVVIGMVAYFQGVANLATLPCLVPTIVLLFFFGWAVATVMACISVHFPDMSHLSEVTLQLWFYATPVMYKPDILRGRGLGWLVDFNPLVIFLDLIRKPLLEGKVPGVDAYGMALSVTACVALTAVMLLVRNERKIVFHL